jgi:hypothetical protein
VSRLFFFVFFLCCVFSVRATRWMRRQHVKKIEEEECGEKKEA